jgi:hypothetical protein
MSRSKSLQLATREIPKGINFHFQHESTPSKVKIICEHSISIIITYLIIDQPAEVDDEDMAEDISEMLRGFAILGDYN